MKFKLLFLILIFPITLFAQKGEGFTAKSNNSEEERIAFLKSIALNGYFGLAFSNTVPQKDYMDNLQSSGPGFGLYGGYRLDPIPLTIGASVDFHFLGGETRYFDNKIYDWTFSKDTLSTSNISVPISLFARVEPNIFNFVFPYAEVGGGFSILNANAEYKSAYWGRAEDKNETTAYLHYYVAAGIMFKLVDFVTLPDKNTRMLLDIKMKYQSGNETEYYTVKSFPDRSVKFDKFRSKVDQIILNVGISFHF